MNRVREALAEHDGELVGRLLPGPLRHLPIFFDIAQGQVEQLAGGVIAGEVAAILDDFSKAHVQALNGIGRVNDGAHFRGIREERNHLLPLASPHCRYGEEFGAPGAFCKLGQGNGRQVRIGRLVYRF